MSEVIHAGKRYGHLTVLRSVDERHDGAQGGGGAVGDLLRRAVREDDGIGRHFVVDTVAEMAAIPPQLARSVGDQ